jgi:thioredoxin 1
MRKVWYGLAISLVLVGCMEPELPHVSGVEVALNEANFQSEVLDSTEPVLVDFGATWCGPCRKMEPVIAHASLNYEGRVKFGKVDIDASQTLAREYGVSGVPSLVLFHRGQEIGRTLGYHSLDDLSAWVDGQVP